MKTKILLVQLGSPKSPAVKDVRQYLKEFLGDPRVVDLNPFFWKIILNLFILPTRPFTSAKLYSRIWENGSFPLIEKTEKLKSEIEKYLKDYDVEVSYILSEPRTSDILEKFEQERKESNESTYRLVVIPLFPQYSQSVTASVFDTIRKPLEKLSVIPQLEFITDFHRSKAFIDSSVLQIEKTLQESETDDLVLSFHGIPKRWITVKKDPYYRHCLETFELIKKNVKSLDQDRIHMAFQSRFGSEEWLTPYTDEYVIDLVKKGNKVSVYCPSFIIDCLETVDEIGNELKEEVEEHSGALNFIPCINYSPEWVRTFSKLIEKLANGSFKEREECNYQIDGGELVKEKPQTMSKLPLSDKAKKSLKLVFTTLFLDLVGFSIIFPLFPQLAKYYMDLDPNNFFLKAILMPVDYFSKLGGSDVSNIVLFGGALGAIYSFLQFIAAPFWGMLSDKIGRRPVLLISVFFLGLSYLLWFFSGSFTLLILARFIGGIMGGNISTATAVVADVTEKENRAKGMAFVGIAFATGFIIGPAMGGVLSLIDLTQIFDGVDKFGINPFSTPALFACILSFINFFFLLRSFKETLPEEKRGKGVSERSINPITLFSPLPYKGVNLTNIGHFFFLLAFSGMEFTLTFLAFERLGYTSMDNAYMFIFIGVTLAFVQGGIVRRKAHDIGEKKLSLYGLISIIPGLVIIGASESSFGLYAGLFFLAIGAALVIPCLTSLVSIYTPPEKQGHSVGIFRSLGALARVIGPIVASLIYWRYGAASPYYLGAAFLILPILLIWKLPNYSKS